MATILSCTLAVSLVTLSEALPVATRFKVTPVMMSSIVLPARL